MFYVLSKLLWIIFAPSFFLPSLIVGALGWAVIRRSRRAAAIAAAAGVALSLVTFTPIGLWSIAWLEHKLPTNASPEPPYGIAAIEGDGARIETLVKLSRQFPA